MVYRSFSSWLLVTTELRLTPQAVLVESDKYVKLIQALVPRTCQVHVGALQDVCLPTLGHGSVCLIDGNFTKEIGNWLSTWGVKRVFYTRQLR
jgi:hypothetical protein